jgi:hypothetical protein
MDDLNHALADIADGASFEKLVEKYGTHLAELAWQMVNGPPQ